MAGAVETEQGAVPDWLAGSLVRHACGAFGETGEPTSGMVDRVTHLFDCIYMGQTYTFHKELSRLATLRIIEHMEHMV